LLLSPPILYIPVTTVSVVIPLTTSDAFQRHDIQRIAYTAAERAAGPRAGFASDVPAYAAGAPRAASPSGTSAGFLATATASCRPANAVSFARLYNSIYMVP
jgi:hypothetical protein